MTLLSSSQTWGMDKHQKKLEEQFAIEGYLDAETVFSRDPLDFRDENNNKVDDRLDKS